MNISLILRSWKLRFLDGTKSILQNNSPRLSSEASDITPTPSPFLLVSSMWLVKIVVTLDSSSRVSSLCECDKRSVSRSSNFVTNLDPSRQTIIGGSV